MYLGSNERDRLGCSPGVTDSSLCEAVLSVLLFAHLSLVTTLRYSVWSEGRLLTLRSTARFGWSYHLVRELLLAAFGYNREKDKACSAFNASERSDTESKHGLSVRSPPTSLHIALSLRVSVQLSIQGPEKEVCL